MPPPEIPELPTSTDSPAETMTLVTCTIGRRKAYGKIGEQGFKFMKYGAIVNGGMIR